MAFMVQRTRPTPKPDLTVPKPRVRFTSANTFAAKAIQANAAREEINEYLKLIAIAEDAIDKHHAVLSAATDKIDALLRAHNLTYHSNGVHEAKITEGFTRQSRTIDPKKFKANVTDKDFWAACKISIEKAESVLTEKEVNSISDVVPAKSTGHHLKIERVGRKVRR